MALPGVRGEPLSRFAVRLLLRKAVATASADCTSLNKKRISPHTIRHGTATALLDAGVDISVIALWLGHESIETTNGYLRSSASNPMTDSSHSWHRSDRSVITASVGSTGPTRLFMTHRRPCGCLIDVEPLRDTSFWRYFIWINPSLRGDQLN
jgi:hypothetical protein